MVLSSYYYGLDESDINLQMDTHLNLNGKHFFKYIDSDVHYHHQMYRIISAKKILIFNIFE